jgi:hypothetical protein
MQESGKNEDKIQLELIVIPSLTCPYNIKLAIAELNRRISYSLSAIVLLEQCMRFGGKLRMIQITRSLNWVKSILAKKP